MRRRVATAGVAVVLALLAGAVLGWRLLSGPSEFERAMGTLPGTTLRATFTDWAATREQAGGEGLDAASSPRQVQAFLDRAFDRDLVSKSAVAESTYALERRYGLSPLEAEWETLGQDRDGQVVVLAFGDGVDLAAAEQRLRTLGYAVPAGGPGSGGTWAGTPELVAALDPGLTPVQQNLAVLPEEGLVLMSDRADAVTRAAEVARGEAEALSSGSAAGASVGAAGEPVVAVLWAADFACQDLSMATADEEDQRVAEQLVAEAGPVSPLTGLVIAQQPDATVRVALSFETEEQAEGNLQPRIDLAAGEAPGQGGSFADRFRVTSAERDGSTVLLGLTPVEGVDYVFSDVTNGPVLFATC